MGLGDLLAIAVGVSMDAFAIAICKGLSLERAEPKHLLSAGLWFGGAQALMTLLGYFLGNGFSSVIKSLDHWISFALLAAIGAHMVRESREPVRKMEASFAPRVMLPLAVADSIDAMAVGVSFAGYSPAGADDRTDDLCFLSSRGEDRQSVRSPVQIPSGGGRRRDSDPDGNHDSDRASASMRKGDSVWQIPISPSGRWQLR